MQIMVWSKGLSYPSVLHFVPHFVLPRTECARHEVRLNVEGRLCVEGRPQGRRKGIHPEGYP
jgi:hypothetical protein